MLVCVLCMLLGRFLREGEWETGRKFSEAREQIAYLCLKAERGGRRERESVNLWRRRDKGERGKERKIWTWQQWLTNNRAYLLTTLLLNMEGADMAGLCTRSTVKAAYSGMGKVFKYACNQIQRLYV